MNQERRPLQSARDLVRRYRETGDRQYLQQYYRRESYRAIYTSPKPKWVRKFRLLIDLMNLKAGEKVLDVGCAAQMLRPYVEAQGAIYKGLDISPSFSPDFVGDAETMETVGDSFNWVVMADILEHLPSPERALARAIQISDCIIAVVPNWYRLERLSFLPRDSGDRHIIRRHPTQWKEGFRQAGWTIEMEVGFFFVPSVAFYPLLPLRVIDRAFATRPFIWLNDHVWNRWAHGFLRYMGQELIIVGKRS